MVETQASRLGIGDRIAIAVGLLAAAVAIAAVAFEHAFPDASTATWRIIFYASLIVAAGALAFLFFDLVIRPRWSIRLALSRRSWAMGIIGIIVLGILGSGGYIASHWPNNFLQSPSGGPIQPIGSITSRLDHFILNCDVPPPPPERTAAQTLAELSEYKQKLDILGDAIGVTFTMVAIRGGIRLEGEATTDEAKQRMWPLSSIGVTKITIEIRRLDKIELISVFVKLPPQLAFYGWIAPNPAAPDTIAVVHRIEQFFGFQPGICHVV